MFATIGKVAVVLVVVNVILTIINADAQKQEKK